MAEKIKQKNEVKKFLLEVPADLWSKWKDTIPRSISINKALVQLLVDETEKIDE